MYNIYDMPDTSLDKKLTMYAPLALKGKTAKLIHLGSGSKEIEISSYTFVGEDL